MNPILGKEFYNNREKLNKLYVRINRSIEKLIYFAEEKDKIMLGEYLKFSDLEKTRYIKYRDFDAYILWHKEIENLLPKYEKRLNSREDWTGNMKKWFREFEKIALAFEEMDDL